MLDFSVLLLVGPFPARLLAEIPHLMDPTANDFQRVDALREWTYAHIPLAASTDVLLDILEPDYASWPLEKVFETPDRDAGALWAHGTAAIFARICARMGYPAAVFHFGDAQSPQNHYVTIVRIEVDGAARFIVQDASSILSWSTLPGLVRLEGRPNCRAGGGRWTSSPSPKNGQPKDLVLAKSADGKPPFSRTSYASWAFVVRFVPIGHSIASRRSIRCTCYSPALFEAMGDPAPFAEVAHLANPSPAAGCPVEERHYRLAKCVYDETEKVVPRSRETNCGIF